MLLLWECNFLKGLAEGGWSSGSCFFCGPRIAWVVKTPLALVALQTICDVHLLNFRKVIEKCICIVLKPPGTDNAENAFQGKISGY